jgi:hypothetical protein
MRLAFVPLFAVIHSENLIVNVNVTRTVHQSADFAHLKKCALSIERFPVSKGVFGNA